MTSQGLTILQGRAFWRQVLTALPQQCQPEKDTRCFHLALTLATQLANATNDYQLLVEEDRFKIDWKICLHKSYMFNIMIVGYSSLYSTKLDNNLWQSNYVGYYFNSL